MTLKHLVKKKIISDVLRWKGGHMKENGRVNWRVLIVDQVSMKILSECSKLHEITHEGIATVENLYKKRAPLPALEAIYLITPSEKSVKALIYDWEPSANGFMYKTAHVFFTETCPDDLFRLLCTTKNCCKHIKTLQELHCSFIPYESQVFSLDDSVDSFRLYFDPTTLSSSECRMKNVDRMAQQIASLCITLGEYPGIRYRSEFSRNEELALKVQQKLDTFRLTESTFFGDQGRSELIILDRGFDCVSPLLHEVTFQAMAYDLLPIENDVYKYNVGDGEREFLLDEHDMWIELRHQDIKLVNKYLIENSKKFTEAKKAQKIDDTTSVKNLRNLLTAEGQNQHKIKKFNNHFQLLEDCLKIYTNRLKNVCQVEQDLATGTNVAGEKIKNVLNDMVPILLGNYTVFEKLRVILLYIIFKNGVVSQDLLLKLMKNANIELDEQCIVHNMAHLGINIIDESKAVHSSTPLIQSNKGVQRKNVSVPRKKRRPNSLTNHVSRWTPVVQDIIEDAIDGTLDKKLFPFLRTSIGARKQNITRSTKYGSWYRDKGQDDVIRFVPRIIIFIVGGVTYSEMRTAYEITKENRSWEVIIGSTHRLVPDKYLEDLKTFNNH